jgi:hypothetical protein
VIERNIKRVKMIGKKERENYLTFSVERALDDTTKDAYNFI